MSSKYGLLALILAPLTFSVAHASEKTQLFEDINQRLSWMKDVAGYKATHHQPVEDLQQEARVSALTLSQAGKIGLHPQSVKPFIIAQMNVAKAIQYRYRADWLTQPEEKWTPLPLTVVREKISQTGLHTLQHLAQMLQNGITIGEGRIQVRSATLSRLS
ncbi:gamma subclass chorismate mutase AroQ [Erwinia sp. V71]|uniref:gamma subclass chorismate mutase AroQ n=1 Tax=Erwinia sp. V71 TaxID=3369424 RepID=UPI003F616172